MAIVLHRKRFEASLPDVATGLLVAMVTADMGSQQPLHPAAEVTIGMRPDGQMEVIGHQAIGEDPQRKPFICLCKQPEKGLIVS